MTNILLKIKMAFIMLWNKLTGKGKTNLFRKGVTATEVRQCLKKCWDFDPQLADMAYLLSNHAGTKYMITQCAQDNAPFQDEVHDCDDFADYMKGHISNDFGYNFCLRATGKTREGQAHAFNIALCWHDGKIVPHIVEPQSGEMDVDYIVSGIRG